MCNFILGFVIAWFFFSFLHQYSWGYNAICLLELPAIIFEKLFELMLYPFVFFYCIFLRHTIRAVDLERIQKLKVMNDSKHLFGPIYFCHDKKAKRFVNKFFFYRVKKA